MQHSPLLKLIGSLLAKKLLAILSHLNVSMFTTFRHLNLSSAKFNQSMRPKLESLTSVLMLFFSSTPRSSKWSLSFRFWNENWYVFLFPPCVPHGPPINLPWSNHYNELWWGVSTEAPHYAFLSSFLLLPPSLAQITTTAPYSQTNWLSPSTTCTEQLCDLLHNAVRENVVFVFVGCVFCFILCQYQFPCIFYLILLHLDYYLNTKGNFCHSYPHIYANGVTDAGIVKGAGARQRMTSSFPSWGLAVIPTNSPQ